MNVHIVVATGAVALFGPVSIGLAGVAPMGPPVVTSFDSAMEMYGSDSGDFGERTPGARGVMTNDTLSMALNMTAISGAQAFLNGGGQFIVSRGPGFTDIGAHRGTGARVQASWDEVVSGGQTFISVIYKTSTGGHLVPNTSNIDGSGINTWNWSVGVLDPIHFQEGVSSVQLVSARAFFSRNAGTSFFGNINILPNLPGDFNPGLDSGLPLLSAGDGTNYVLIRYQIDVTIPAPASGVALASGLVLLTRRRR